MDKPARLQVEPSQLPGDRPPQTGNVFNVWYLQWSGGDGSKQIANLKFRVNIKRDSGFTKANTSKVKTSIICLYFSKGCCYKGAECSYLHRLPNQSDYYPPTQDCFGRDKTYSHKDDMNGVGVLNKVNNTLYIGGLHVSTDHTEAVLSKHFGEFGKIVKIKVLANRNCAFVTYKNEFEAQFAKEAMQNQSLDDKEVLMIRWASEDPDPASQKEAKEQLESVTRDTVKRLLEQEPQQQHEEYEHSEEYEEYQLSEEHEENEQYEQYEEHEHELHEEHEQPKSPKLILNSMFNEHSLNVLSNVKRRKPNPEPKQLLEMLAYSSDDDE